LKGSRPIANRSAVRLGRLRGAIGGTHIAHCNGMAGLAL